MLIASVSVFGLLTVASLLIPINSPTMTRILPVVVGFLLLLPMIRAVIRRDPLDLVELIYAVALGYLIYILLPFVKPPEEGSFAYPWLTQVHLNRVLLYLGWGFSLFLLGYYGPLPSWIARGLPRLRPDARPGWGHTLIYSLYGLGTALRMYLLAHESYTWSVKMQELEYGSALPAMQSNIVGYLSQFAFIAYVLATTHFFAGARTRSLSVALWGIMFPLELLWALLVASKIAFLSVLASPLIAYNYLRKKVTPLHLVLPVLLYVYIVFPVVAAYRDIGPYYPIRLQTLPRDLPFITGEVIREITSPDTEVYIGGGTELVTERAQGLLPVANVLFYVDERGPLHGAIISQLPLVVIPASVFPKKYEYFTASGILYAEEISGASDTSSGIALMQIGEFYLDYGLAGLLIGMFLQGILCRTWQSYWVGLGGPLAIATFIIGWQHLVLIEVPIAFAYGLFIRESLIMFFILWLMSLSKQPSQEARPVGGVA